MPKNPTAEVNLKVPVTIRWDPAARVYVVWSGALDLSAQGRSQDQALNNFAEAVQLWFESCSERGTLADALQELGWRRISRPRPQWIPPEVLQRNVSVRIPTYSA